MCDEAVDFDNLDFIAAGKSGVVYGLDARRVLKEYHDSDGAEAERRAYQRLGAHPNIARLLSTRSDGSIILERGQSLRTVCQSRAINDIAMTTKLGWLLSAARGYQHIHDHGIIHSDVGCHNQILTSDGDLKIIDFEGCSIDGEEAGSCYEWFSYRPSDPRVTRATDIFAFGCGVYEIMAGRPPYHELAASDDKYRQVEELYKDDQFPDTAHLPLSSLMLGCWHGRFTSMEEIRTELEAFSTSL